MGRDQRIRKGAAGRVIAKDIGRQRDAMPGACDRGQHGRIGGVPALENLKTIAVGQRAVDDLGVGTGEERDIFIQRSTGHWIPED